MNLLCKVFGHALHEREMGSEPEYDPVFPDPKLPQVCSRCDYDTALSPILDALEELEKEAA